MITNLLAAVTVWTTLSTTTTTNWPNKWIDDGSPVRQSTGAYYPEYSPDDSRQPSILVRPGHYEPNTDAITCDVNQKTFKIYSVAYDEDGKQQTNQFQNILVSDITFHMIRPTIWKNCVLDWILVSDPTTNFPVQGYYFSNCCNIFGNVWTTNQAISVTNASDMLVTTNNVVDIGATNKF